MRYVGSLAFCASFNRKQNSKIRLYIQIPRRGQYLRLKKVKELSKVVVRTIAGLEKLTLY